MVRTRSAWLAVVIFALGLGLKQDVEGTPSTLR